MNTYFCIIIIRIIYFMHVISYPVYRHGIEDNVFEIIIKKHSKMINIIGIIHAQKLEQPGLTEGNVLSH